MLEFIVLGLIPGTQIQITFTWVLAAVLSSVAFYELLTFRRQEQFVEEKEEDLG